MVTCLASLISIILGTLAAYALSRYRFKFGFVKNNDITFFFISQRIMPPVVLSIPFFIMLSTLGLLDSVVGLIMVYIVLLMPIAVWIMVDFFNKVPREIDETALIDGCNPFEAFFQVVLPNSIPGLVVAGMFCLIFGWTDFFFSSSSPSRKCSSCPSGSWRSTPRSHRGGVCRRLRWSRSHLADRRLRRRAFPLARQPLGSAEVEPCLLHRTSL